jgi:hypothetical protein
MNISTKTTIPAFDADAFLHQLDTTFERDAEIAAKRILDSIASNRDLLAQAQKQCDDADILDDMGRVSYEAGQEAIVKIERGLGELALRLLALVEREDAR